LSAANGQFYTANDIYGQGSVIGSGFAVYNGTDHSVTVTGLKPSTYYYITNAEYNTDGTTIIYNTSGISMSTSTRSAPTTAPVTAPTPLPVELVSFTGSVNTSNIAILRWTTASERNSAYFSLERSADGTSFIEAGRVAAAAVSSQTLAYQLPDPLRLLHPTYYRLRQVDLDGIVRYSNVITLTPKLPVAQLLEIYPNPSSGQDMQLLLQGYDGESLSLRVADALGRIVMAQSLAPTTTQFLTPLLLPQGLAAGTYVLTLAGSNSPIQKRIVVSN
jgi:hypothetical protein